MSRDESYDVIVCGYGGAGAACAIQAHDAGARVLVVEKATEGGGSTQESGGSLATIEDRDGAVEHYLALTEGRTPRSVMEAYVDAVLALPEWIEANDGTLEVHPMRRPPFPHRFEGTAYSSMPRGDAIGKRVRLSDPDGDHGGTSLWRFLDRNVRERGIDVRFGVSARGLEVEDGRVVGVQLDTSGDRRVVRADRGVVLTCGGFACDPELLLDATGIRFAHLSPPGRNTGDGVRMAQAVGADLWHMNCVAAGFGYQVPEHEAAWMCAIPAYGFFVVDDTGRRFMDEPMVEHHAANHALAVRNVHTGHYPRLPSHLVFDEQTRLAGRIATTEAGDNRRFHWSEDNSDEVAKGWIQQADDIRDLATTIGVPTDALAATFEEFQAMATGERRDRFGRTQDTAVPLQPPYYAIEVVPALFNTQGGPRRDAHGRVLAVGGDPIPGLYSAGELGSVWAALYPGAGNVTEAVVTGRVSGASAAAGR